VHDLTSECYFLVGSRGALSVRFDLPSLSVSLWDESGVRGLAARWSITPSEMLVAGCPLERHRVHRDRVSFTRARCELQIRPRDHDLFLTHAAETAHTDHNVADLAGLSVDQQLIDLTDILAFRILDAGATMSTAS
jgi:hypothetical protein